MTSHDYSFKLLLIGDSNVGKTSILTQFVDNLYSDCFISTIGVDFKVKTLTIDQLLDGKTTRKSVKLWIWDTAGQDRFQSITSSYYRGAHGIIVCYDTTSKESFDNITKWISQIEHHSTADRKINTILVGTKSDLVTKRQVLYQTAQEFADSHNMKYIEVSSKTGTNIDLLFNTITQEMTQNPTIPVTVTPTVISYNKSSSPITSLNCKC